MASTGASIFSCSSAQQNIYINCNLQHTSLFIEIDPLTCVFSTQSEVVKRNLWPLIKCYSVGYSIGDWELHQRSVGKVYYMNV